MQLQSVIIFDITNCKSIIYSDIFVEFYIKKLKFRVKNGVSSLNLSIILLQFNMK